MAEKQDEVSEPPSLRLYRGSCLRPRSTYFTPDKGRSEVNTVADPILAGREFEPSPEKQATVKNDPLRIGDTILLYTQEGDGYAYVYSNISCNKLQNVCVYPVGSSWSDPILPNIHCACYKVLTANRYKAQDRLVIMRQKLKLQYGKNFESQLTVEEKRSLKTAQKNADKEVKENDSDQERLSGQSVLYGAQIQLQHTFTKKFLAVNPSFTSLLESTNLKIDLTQDNSQTCIFTILPRYRIRSVGDEVRMNDQVMFESYKTEGQFLHSSDRKFNDIGESLNSNCHELNLSASESSFIIVPHFRPNRKAKDGSTLKANSCVRLFHREMECYLVAEGSFAEEIKVVTEGVHLRRRKTIQGKLKEPSTSAITYWAIEKKPGTRNGEDSKSGETINWGEKVCFKHLLTQQYLSIPKDQNVLMLVEKTNSTPDFDKDTTFKLLPVITGENEIQFETYARIYHPSTKTWLHGDKENGQPCPYECVSRKVEPGTSGLSALAWDDAEVFRACGSSVMAYDDAFTLMKVSDDLTQKFNYVSGMVPLLKAYLGDRRRRKPLSESKARAIAEALKELSTFIEDPNTRQKNSQKLIRNLRILDLLVDILKLYEPEALDASAQKIVCCSCYKVIEVFLQGDSRKNELYVSRFVPFFEEQMRQGLNAEDMLVELVRDNPNIVSRISQAQIDKIIGHLLELKDCRFLDCLGVACVCENKAAVSSQNYIVDILLEKHGKDLFFETSVRMDVSSSKQSKKIFFQDGSKEWRPLSEIAHSSLESHNMSQTTCPVRWLQSQLDLFGKLANGNNENAIEVITKKFIPFEEALVGADDSDLHPAIRSKYVELIRVLFVDVGNNRAFLENLPNSFVYNEVKEVPFADTEGDSDTALTGEKNIHFDDLRKWILKAIKGIENQALNCSQESIGENQILVQILGILESLVKYGYYDDPRDIDEVLKFLISLLDGSNDVPFPNSDPITLESFRSAGRYQNTAANRAVFAVKEKIMAIFDLLFNYRFYLRLQRFVYDYRCLKGEFVGGGRSAIKCDPASHVAISLEPQSVSYSRDDLSIPLVEVADIEQQPIARHQRKITKLLRIPLFSQQSDGPPSQLYNLEKLGLKVFEDECLMSTARARLQYIFKPTALFEDLRQRVGTGDSNVRNHAFVKILLDIAGYQDNDLVIWSLHLLNRYCSSETDIFMKATESQLLVCPHSKATRTLVEMKITEFRKITLHELDVFHMRKLQNILEQMTKLCLLDEYLQEPHIQNQKILFNYNVFSNVMALLFDSLAGGSHRTMDATSKESSKDGLEDAKGTLLKKCFQFLAAFARNNRAVQKSLFHRMDDLLAIDQSVADMANVLYEVFNNFQEVCLQVQEYQVEKVFCIITHANSEAKAALLQMLQALTHTKMGEFYLPLKRNQAFIMKYYSKNRKFFEQVLGHEKGKQERRMELLTTASDSDNLLVLLLNVTDLLASCCEGKNSFIESICQTIFSMEELMKYLTTKAIVAERKRPFCRFLIWVYLNTGAEAEAMKSTSKSQMREYLEDCRSVIAGLSAALKGVPVDQGMLVKRELRRKKIDTEEPTAEMSPRPTSAVTDVVGVTGLSGEFEKGVFAYFMEGILPMLTAYCRKLSQMSQNEDTQHIYTLLGSITSVLMELTPNISPYFSTSEQGISLRNTLFILNRSPQVNSFITVDNETIRMWHAFAAEAKSIKSEFMKTFEEEYGDELELNTSFNAYVRSYELAFNGPNTIQCQIGVQDPNFRDAQYSEFLDTEMTVKGDEYLPLGPSFQNLVSCFIIQEHSTVTVLRKETNHLIHLLDLSFNEFTDLTEAQRMRLELLNIKCLQVLRAMIHNEIKRIDPESKENSPDKYRKMAENIERVQCAIQTPVSEENTIAKIVPMLAHTNDAIAAEVLAFLSVFLYDGNRDVQAGFEYLTSTREERFFINIRKRLSHAMAIDREKRALQARLQEKQSENMSLNSGEHLLHSDRNISSKEEATDTDGCTTQEELDVSEYHGRSISSDAALAAIDVSHQERGEGDMQTVPPHWMKADIFLQKHQERMAQQESKKKGFGSNLGFQDTTYVELTLRVLGLMCDGQNRALQNYLREQPDNINNVNLVGEVALFLQHFYSDINKDNIELINRILQTLVEMCVGNYYNQEVIFDHQIIDIVNRILQTPVFNRCRLQDVVQMKASAIELLETILEETHKETPKLVENVHSVMDLDAVFNTLVYFYYLKDDSDMCSLKMDDDATRALFRTFHILKHLPDFGIDVPEPVKPSVKGLKEFQREEDIWEAWKYCSERSKSVEILYENMEGDKTLSKVHFHYNPDDELSDELVERVTWKINRDSAEDKVRDFLDWMKAVKRDVKHVNSLRDHWYTRLFIFGTKYQNWALIFLTLLLNVLVLASWNSRDDVYSGKCFTQRTLLLNSTVQKANSLPTIPLVQCWFGYIALFVLGVAHFGITLIQVISYFIMNYPNFHLPSLYYKYIKRKKRDSTYSDVPIFGLKTLYYLIILACSGLSLVFWGYFYSICLVHIVVNNDILQRVLRSVTKNGKSLLWVGALGFVVLYIYAVISYVGYQSYFDDPENSGHCKTLFQCSITTIRLGLLGGSLLTNGDTRLDFEPGYYILRTIFDVSFFIIVTTVGLNIIFGIIVDTFSELRDERYQTEADKKGFCFICSFPAYEFERHATGFKDHVKHEHNMWNYIYFSLELDRIDSTNQNAIQQYVYNQVANGDTDFFPILRARCLKDVKDTTQEEIAELKSMVEGVIQCFKVLNEKIDKVSDHGDNMEEDVAFRGDTSTS